MFEYSKYRIKINNFDTNLKNILETTSFNYMKEMEAKAGFNEAMPWNNFFRRGKKEQWKYVSNM